MTNLPLRCLLPVLLVFVPCTGVRAEALPVLAEIGPWPTVSNLIAFKGRIWFVNSVRYADYNSADVYSYDLRSGEVRFERSLFSQDAGRPAIHRGLLYWPYEDPISNQGWGEITATDGENWRLFVVRSDVPSFHIHALASARDRLFASSSAWVAGIDVSEDGGLTWRRIHSRQSPNGGIARVLDLVSDGRIVYGPALQWTAAGAPERTLLRADRDNVSEVAGWPSDAVSSLAVFRNRLYATVGGEVWRAAQQSSERVSAEGGRRFARLAADGTALYGLIEEKEGAEILKSADGRHWSHLATLSDGDAEDMLVHNGAVFVGGHGSNGRGILWGPREVMADPPSLEASRWPEWNESPVRVDWNAAAVILDEALRIPVNYENHGRALRDIVSPWLNADPPDDFFARRLGGPFPPGEVEIFGGQRSVARAEIGRWVLLWAMAVSRTGRVPVSLFTVPWSEAPNRPQKWFHPTPMALHAAQWLSQSDRTSLDALVTRLDQPSDPDWLRHEVMTTLATLTGQPLPWKPEAWRAWWARVRERWPDG